MRKNYEPETVAIATVRGVPNVRVIHDDRKPAWLTGATVGGFQWHSGIDQVTDVRQLVVLDLAEIGEDGASTWAELVAALRVCGDIASICVADQIEAQTKPVADAELAPAEGGALVWSLDGRACPECREPNVHHAGCSRSEARA